VFYQKVRKSGNSYVVTIPREEMEARGIREGDQLAIDVQKVEIRPALAPDVREAFERSWARNEAGYRYLAKR
jgi:putative addiction module antidote